MMTKWEWQSAKIASVQESAEFKQRDYSLETNSMQVNYF